LWIIYVLLGLILIAGIFLCMPVSFLINLDTYQSPHLQTRMRCLFGIIDLDLVRRKKKDESECKKKAPNKKHKRGIGIKKIISLLKVKGLFPRVFRFIRSVIKQIQIKDLTVNFKIGLEDPVDTGYLCAITTPLNFFIKSRFHRDFEIQTVFEGDIVLEGKAFTEIRIIPIRLVAITLGLIFSLPVFRAAAILIFKK
jgi:hypothetical protein